MPDQFPKISIVTATYNQAAYIEDCILSILDQQYPNLEYIIIDGGSTDGTADIIRKYEDRIHYWVSEKDQGLYHALQKGFIRASGDIMGWINSDDMLHRKSLFSIAAIFSQNQEAQWIQGYPTVMEDSGRVVFHRQPCFSRYFFYLKKYHNGTFIQQESTYWRRELWLKSGSHISVDYKYAGDFELWIRFFRYADMYITLAFVGAFRLRGPGQMSADNYTAYLKECDTIIDRQLKELPADELKLIDRMRREEKRKAGFPLFDKIARKFGSHYTDLLTTPRRIEFDFEKSVFRS